MAIKTTEELMNQVRELIGDNTDDNSISMLEDLSDTLGQFKEEENWKQKYEENDASWRKRYKERFETPVHTQTEDLPKPEDDTKRLTYEALFKKGD